MNFSYRERLTSSEKIIEGEPLPERFEWKLDSVVDLSVEKKFADKFGLKLGDVLTFEIQGIIFKAKVKNVRAVKWNTFNPNFACCFLQECWIKFLKLSLLQFPV